MTLHVGPVEWFWLVVNVTAALITVLSLRHAYLSRAAVRALNGKAPRLVAGGDVRREWIRLAIQAGLVIVVIPNLFIDREIRLFTDTGPNFGLIALILVPVGILANSALDAIDRQRLLRTEKVDLIRGRLRNRREGDR